MDVIPTNHVFYMDLIPTNHVFYVYFRIQTWFVSESFMQLTFHSNFYFSQLF